MTLQHPMPPANRSRITDANAPRKLQAFRHSEDGSLVIFGLFIFLLMLMIGGLALDVMRFETHRVRLQSTLDRAVLAAASMSQPLEPEAVIADYFSKAGLDGTLQSTTVDNTATGRHVTATAGLYVPSTLMRLVGVEGLNAPAGGAAEESASLTEISLVVDVSGSMGRSSSSGNTKIYEIRQAARQFVNIMQCDPENPEATTGCVVEEGKVSITLVPYNEQVLVGERLLSRFNVTDEHHASSCVTFDEADFQTSGITPTQLLQRTGHFDPWSSGGAADTWTCQPDSWRQILPFGGAPALLRDQIGDLRAGGYTSIDLGMKWGMAFLDPSLQPVIAAEIDDGQVIPEFAGRPYNWDERGASKVIVLMTDGVNTTQHYLYDTFRDGLSPVWYNEGESAFSIYREATDSWYWESDDRFENHPYGDAEPGEAVQMTWPELWAMKSWGWYGDFPWLSAPGSSLENLIKNQRLQAACDAAKDRNILIFTVGFEVTSSSGAIMRECASTPSHYFDVQGEDLTRAFAAIARQISKLRLVN